MLDYLWDDTSLYRVTLFMLLAQTLLYRGCISAADPTPVKQMLEALQKMHLTTHRFDSKAQTSLPP